MNVQSESDSVDRDLELEYYSGVSVPTYSLL